jgi:hypothetical protein
MANMAAGLAGAGLMNATQATATATTAASEAANAAASSAISILMSDAHLGVKASTAFLTYSSAARGQIDAVR